MDKGLAVLITAVAGGLIALQAPINADLGNAKREPGRSSRLLRRR
jgi:uncharacterized membrane protein YdcZ (DUF606 family)